MGMLSEHFCAASYEPLQDQEKTYSSVAITRALGNVGMSLQALSEHEQALRYFRQQWATAKDLEDYGMQVRAQISIGSSQGAIGHRTDALKVFQGALRLLKLEKTTCVLGNTQAAMLHDIIHKK